MHSNFFMEKAVKLCFNLNISTTTKIRKSKIEKSRKLISNKSHSLYYCFINNKNAILCNKSFEILKNNMYNLWKKDKNCLDIEKKSNLVKSDANEGLDINNLKKPTELYNLCKT